MTLIITTISPDAVTMVGDRRLTTNNGQIFNDNVGKQGYLLTHDVCALYAYTGIAIAGQFNLQHWIGDKLLEISENREVPFDELMESLAAAATETFNSHPDFRAVKKTQNHTTIVFAGYACNGDPIAAIVSNFEDDQPYPHVTPWDSFKSTPFRSSSRLPTASMTLLSGNVRGLKFNRWEKLNRMVLNGKPINALLQKSDELLMDAAKLPESENTIGTSRLMASLTAPKDNNPSVPVSKYVSEIYPKSLHALDMVDLRVGHRFFVRDMAISGASTDAQYPKQGPNEKCACGSGRKYKKCHGKRS